MTTGAIWTLRGREFDGVDDKLSLTDSAPLSAIASITIECWFNQDAQAAEGLVSKRADGASGKREWEFVIDSSGRLRVVLGADAEPGANHIVAVGTRDLSDSNWHHGVITWNGINATGNVALYSDGEVEVLTEDIKNGVGAVPWDSAFDIEIGRYYSNTYCFTGKIGEVRIYNRALTSLEIQHNYLATKWRYR